MDRELELDVVGGFMMEEVLLRTFSIDFSMSLSLLLL